MKKTNFLLLLVIAILFNGGLVYGEEKVTIKIAGSGGMIPLVNKLAKEFMAVKNNIFILVNQQSIQSGGGIKGVVDGELQVGMANRPFKDEEKQLGLQDVEIARVGIVIGANKDINIKTISSENLCKIYEGKTTNWQGLGGNNEKIVALTKSEKDATKETLRKSIKCFKDLQEPKSIIVVETSRDMTQALGNAKCIGFTDLVAVEESEGKIVALKLDNVEPTAENVRSGKYKVVQGYRLVTKGKPTGAIKEFVDFIKGPVGTKIIEAQKAVALK